MGEMEDSILRNPDATDMSPLRLGDIGTPGSDTGMPPLRLSDIMTPCAELRRDGDDSGTAPVDSGHEASAPTTAIAGWQIRVPDPPTTDSETAGRLKRDVCRLNDENRLLKQKLDLLQKNSNLKQVALIGTVISWFGDKGFLEDDVNTAYRLTSAMLSARESEQVGQSVADGSNKLDDVPWKQHTANGTPDSALNATNICLHSPSPDADSNARHSMNDDTSKWLSPSSGSSFNPPFSSSRKESRRPTMLPEDGTLLTKCDPGQGVNQGKPVDPASFQFPHEVKTDSFDDDAKRLDTRLRRMEDALNVFSDRHAETRSRMTRLRQNAVKRFRVWKAIAASRRLAAVNSASDGEEQESEDRLTDTSTTPTPLTQYPLENPHEEIRGSKTAVGGSINQTILGEIVFQVERRILAFVFQRKEMLYGYNLGNLDIMIRTYPEQGSRSLLQRRCDLLMNVLRSYGWSRGRHPQFVAKMIARHGTLQDVETAKAEAMKRGWRNPSELKRGVLCLCPITEVLDMLVILDCLLHMARNDGLPVFLW